MRFPKQPIERKLSDLLGTQVTIEKLSVSPLRGTLDVGNVTVASAAGAYPLLTIRRIQAELSVGALLRKEVVIKSIGIEGVIATIERLADGSTNLPKRGDGTRANSVPAEGASDDAPSSWTMAAEKVQLLDGAVHFRESAYHGSAERITGELIQKPDGIHITLLAASVGRRDEPLELGEARLHGVLSGIDSFAKLASGGLDATFEIADVAQGSVRAPALNGKRFDVDLRAKLMLDLLQKLLPPRSLPTGVVA